MPRSTPIASLHALHRRFGPAVAAQKLALLREIRAQERIAAPDLVVLQAVLDLMRAYPDDAKVLGEVRAVRGRLRDWVGRVRGGGGAPVLAGSGVPGSVTTHPFSLDVVRRLDACFPGCLEVAWDDLEADEVFGITIELLLTAGENEGMEDLKTWWPDWIAQCRPASVGSDLAFVLHLLERSPFSPQQRECLFEACALPVRYTLDVPGTGLCEVEFPCPRVACQKTDVPRERFPLAAEIQRPLPPSARVPAREGRRLLDLALAALCSRRLEILPLTGSNPRDVFVFDGPRGIQVLLAGVVPGQRAPLSALFLFLVLKNGVPVAYGPAVPFLGCCELGINLFAEFRGFEIRTIYAQVMRVLHQVAGADLFFLTKYAMGVDNEDALRTGAFWFYRKLGFRPSNPAVEVLARREEERMQVEPGHRSDRATLKRLSQTEAWLDLSDGRCRPFDFARLSLVLSRFLARAYDADRPRAVAACTAKVGRALGVRGRATWSSDEKKAFADLAPILALMPDLPGWTRAEKTEMVRIIRGKAASSEIDAAWRMRRHPRFEASLRAVLER